MSAYASVRDLHKSSLKLKKHIQYLFYDSFVVGVFCVTRKIS